MFRQWLLAPATLLLGLLFAVPLLILLVCSFQERGVYGGVLPVATAGNYLRLADSLYVSIFFRTFVMAAVSTLGCLFLGFPLALFIARSGQRRNLYLQLVMLPFWTSFLIRTYAWLFLLRDTGLINTLLLKVGLIQTPLPLLYNDGAVFLGLVYGYLPFVVLPLYASLERIDPSMSEAAADLGARPWSTLTQVIAPLCAPGFRAATVLTFIPCLGAYLTPDLLGGGKSVMAGNLIGNQFTTARDWPFGSAVSLTLMLVSMILLGLWMRRDEEAL